MADSLWANCIGLGESNLDVLFLLLPSDITDWDNLMTVCGGMQTMVWVLA